VPGPEALAELTAPDARNGPPAGLGVDIVSVHRIRDMVGRCGPDVLDRLLTPGELADSRGARGLIWTRLAGRIAAKEATKKVLGSRGQTARWTEVEVRLGGHGEPYVKLHGRTRLAAERCGFTRFLLSISHEKAMAIAVVLGW
jgi:holo-[acyl-carrier protein] synthase